MNMTTLTKITAEPPSTTFVFATPAPAANLPVPNPAPLAYPTGASCIALEDALAARRDAADRAIPYRGWAIVGGLVSAGLLAWNGMSALTSGATGSLVCVGLGVAGALGATYLWTQPPRDRQRADRAFDASIASITRDMPVPAANASHEERLVTAWIGKKVLRGVSVNSHTAATREYVAAIWELDRNISEAQMGRVTPILEAMLDYNGKPQRRLQGIDVLGERIRRLPADVRVRLLKVLEEPLKNAHREDEHSPSPWRRQAFEDALEGKEFRYGSLVTQQHEADLPAMHPDRIRYEQINDSIDDQLKHHARHGQSALVAKASLPPEMGEQQAFRLAAHYEAMGYRAYLHPSKGHIFMTVSTADDIPNASFIESNRDSNAHTVRLEG
jgi:hypothetical protein